MSSNDTGRFDDETEEDYLRENLTNEELAALGEPTRAPIMVRYCTPEDCQDPRCANYRPANGRGIVHIALPEVPRIWRGSEDAYRAGLRLDRDAFPAHPGPDRMAYQAGWIAGKRREFEVIHGS